MPLRHRIDPPTVPTEVIYRLTVEQYRAMSEAGILTKDDPVELLEGLLVAKYRKTPRHVTTARSTRDEFEKRVSADWLVESQGPFDSETSEPEPDVAVVRGPLDRYRQRHPVSQEVALAVEIADLSLLRDRGIKKRAYAAATIPSYWIVNLVDSQVEVYTDPTGPASQPDYRQRQDYGPTDVVPLVLDGMEVARIPVSDLLP
jgi:Uma2 family endonuclease